MAITKITNHVEQAILRLPIQFRRNWRDNLRPANVGPTASFSFVTSGLEVTFTDLSSDSDGLIVAWSWNFGDGNTSTEQNPVHTYATGDDYEVTLTVTDDNGASTSFSTTVAVNAAPTAAFSVEVDGLTITVTDESTDPEDSLASWDLDWGDGSPHASGPGPWEHEYASADTYTVTLTVTDAGGLTDEASDDVTVESVVVPTDGPDEVYLPESTAHFAALPVAVPPPTDIYLCDESSGDLASATGTDALVASGAGLVYGQSLTGWAAKFVRVTEGELGHFARSVSLAEGESCFVLAICSYAAPSTTKLLLQIAGADNAIGSRNSGLLRTTHGGNTINTSSDLDNIGTATALLWARNATADESGLYTPAAVNLATHDESAVSGDLAIGRAATGGCTVRVCRIYRWVGADADALIAAGLANETLLEALGWTVAY